MAFFRCDDEWGVSFVIFGVAVDAVADDQVFDDVVFILKDGVVKDGFAFLVDGEGVGAVSSQIMHGWDIAQRGGNENGEIASGVLDMGIDAVAND